ncbi:MAG: ATP-binding cassette domain-containing protein [Clostridiales bacterium]
MNLTICKLTKYYNNQLVFKNIDMIMEAGNVYGLKGDNGSGKSTLFRIIAGLEKQTFGEVLYNKKKFDNTVQRKITYMHQKPYMMKKTVFKNILYPLTIRNKIDEKDIKKTYKIMEELDLYKFKDKKAWNLSGGEMQKVSLARAIIFEPEILLMDEPTAHMDKKTVETIEKMVIKRQRKNKMLTAIITHDTKSLDRLFDRVYYL